MGTYDEACAVLGLSCVHWQVQCTCSRHRHFQACVGVVGHAPWPNCDVFVLRLDKFHAIYVPFSLHRFLYSFILILSTKDMDYDPIDSKDSKYGCFATLISTDFHKF